MATAAVRAASATQLAKKESDVVSMSADRVYIYNMGMDASLIQHIDRRAGKCGGKPCVSGTRIRVWDIYVLHERLGKTADEIIGDYPELGLSGVHAALAYYYDHKDEIDAEMKAADDFVEQLRAASPPGPLAKKLASTDASSDPVSS